jgi:hypothetical protein
VDRRTGGNEGGGGGALHLGLGPWLRRRLIGFGFFLLLAVVAFLTRRRQGFIDGGFAAGGVFLIGAGAGGGRHGAGAGLGKAKTRAWRRRVSDGDCLLPGQHIDKRK